MRKKTELRRLELIIKERRRGHVLRIENSKIPRQATQMEPRGYKILTFNDLNSYCSGVEITVRCD